MWAPAALTALTVALVVVAVVLRARSIERQQKEHGPADDLKRADAHDPNPPFDDTAGWL